MDEDLGTELLRACTTESTWNLKVLGCPARARCMLGGTTEQSSDPGGG